MKSKRWGSLGASKRSRRCFIPGQLVEGNNHIPGPLTPLYSSISTFISSLVGSFHPFVRNADHTAFRWLRSRNAYWRGHCMIVPLRLHHPIWKLCLKLSMLFVNLEVIIFLFGKCGITHLRWFFKNLTGNNVFIISFWNFSFKIISSELLSLPCHSVTCAGKWFYLFLASL